MQGRVENDMEIKRWLDIKLMHQPVILRQYVDSLSDAAWSTKQTYLKTLIQFFDWLKETKRLNDITREDLVALIPADINAYIAKIKYITRKDGTIRECSSSNLSKAWTSLNSLFEFMYINDLAPQNIMQKVKRPRNTDKPNNEYLSQKQMKKLMHKVERTKDLSPLRIKFKTRDTLIIKLFLTTGMRAEPLREINVEDIDFESKTVLTVNKGHKTIRYSLIDSVMETLESWLDQRAKMLKQPRDQQVGPLLIDKDLERMSYRTVNLTVKYYTAMIGIEGGYSCHKLRHSYGTAVYMITKDINYTKEKLGHSNVAVTMRYINEIDKDMDNLVENKMSSIVS